MRSRCFSEEYKEELLLVIDELLDSPSKSDTFIRDSLEDETDEAEYCDD